MTPIRSEGDGRLFPYDILSYVLVWWEGNADSLVTEAHRQGDTALEVENQAACSEVVRSRDMGVKPRASAVKWKQVTYRIAGDHFRGVGTLDRRPCL